MIGGGLLGLEAARGLLSHELNVTVVEVVPHLMIQQLDPTGGVSGVVRSGSLNPVAGAIVRLAVPDQSFFRNTTTDSSGVYHLFDVPVGTYTVTATDPILFFETTGEVTVAQDQTAPLNLTFTLVFDPSIDQALREHITLQQEFVIIL